MANSSIGYRGEVTIQLQKNGRVIKIFKGKNEGCSLLFGSIAEALTGNYVNSEGYRPKFIQLFHGGVKGGIVPDDFDTTRLTDRNRRTLSTMMYTTSSYVNYSKGDASNPYGTDAGEAAFKFVIPFLQIDTDRSEEERDINVFALYGTKNKSNYTMPLAYYKLVDADGKWDTLFKEDPDSEYNVVIIWKLIIENK